MLVGLYQFGLLSRGQGPPSWMVGAHAHLGVLSIIGIVTGFAVDSFDLAGRLRTAVTALFLIGQWLLPATIWIGEGVGITTLLPTMLLWGIALILSMLLMAWAAWTRSTTTDRGPGVAMADD
ncbi:MAG: hypothetical protein ABEI80_05200 [Haloplanus sp.]